ncbi:uncharacterized protein (DUF58 family) [Desulfobotulus alkaliphilus]|uniref:Uncharacterized protein (DUF58 family) n=1 Tax=Desulfobotulus alkaliphilus TaxID=622671 RepID=A0A562RPX5_9BACT|nr:DUF58 domain-containing protein [Desulfobotulus alkaliphilus]TWI71147.1 uncharacterized protein (DUF58 family) [Desulfobotulus alkaliphilus]
MKAEKRKIFILPTPAGLFMGIILLVTLVASLNENNNLGLLLTFFLFSMALCSSFSTHRNLKGILIKGMECPPVFAENPICIRLHLFSGNHGRTGLTLCSRKKTSQPVSIDKSSTGILELRLPAAARGIYQLPALTLQCRAPLGLFYAWIRLPHETEAVVYPKPLAGPLPESEGKGAEKQPSGRKAQSMGNEDFEGHKSYVPGDPISRIDWKIFSRDRGMHIKNFESAGKSLVLDFNAFNNMDTEERLSRLCHGILQAASRNMAYGLRLPDREVGPASSRQHREQCLYHLAAFQGENTAEDLFSMMLHAIGEEKNAFIIK